MPKKKKFDALGNEIRRGAPITHEGGTKGRIVLCMSPMEAARMRHAAKLAGKSIATWARDILLPLAPEVK